jgi:hypothetical protein
MAVRFTQLLILAVLITASAIAVLGQPPDMPDASSRSGRDRKADLPAGVKEMIAKQKAERERKDHEAMLARGEEALRLAKQLENSFATTGELSQQDKSRLESLEKVVAKIRKELGGDDDDGDVGAIQGSEEPRPSNLQEAFKYLQSTTVKLVDELKKTTRFSISAVAIQSSNTVLKLVRFLRIRK